MIKHIIIASMLVLTTACTLTTPAHIVGGTILASDSVDSMKIELGEHSHNQDVIAELDKLQYEILETVATGRKAYDVVNYHNRALVIYAKLKHEAVARKSEMTDKQWSDLATLDSELVDLHLDVLKLREKTDSSGIDLNLLYTATTLIKFYGLL